MFPLNLISLIPGLFNTVNNVTNAIANERIKKIQANTEEEKIQADERIKTLEARRDVLLADADKSKIDMYIRASIGGSVAFLLGKILVWDKALGEWTHGNTDKLDPNLWSVITATIGFYFLYSAITNTTKILKN